MSSVTKGASSSLTVANLGWGHPLPGGAGASFSAIFRSPARRVSFWW